jgi:hypothetical protein
VIQHGRHGDVYMPTASSTPTSNCGGLAVG